jgi:hypothetical protein
LLGVLDAAAPCAALLAASVEMGRMADGTHEGMPTKVRWAIESPFGRVHPVELYSAIAWLALCAVLLWVVRVARREGETAAWGLVLGGLVIFGMDFFRLPSEMYGAGIFDRVQWQGIALMVAGRRDAGVRAGCTRSMCAEMRPSCLGQSSNAEGVWAMPSKNMLPKGHRRRSVRAEYRATRGVEAEPEAAVPVLDFEEDTEVEDGVRTFVADVAAAGMRLDAYLAQAIPEISRARGATAD